MVKNTLSTCLVIPCRTLLGVVNNGMRYFIIVLQWLSLSRGGKLDRKEAKNNFILYFDPASIEEKI